MSTKNGTGESMTIKKSATAASFAFDNPSRIRQSRAPGFRLAA
jgi:hypothetical protein